MADEDNKPVKVEAVAKATYKRERNITETVPPDVTRAKASAWLDLISPVTEWAGLKGDELRHRREQLRLQREDVLAEIAQRYIERRGNLDAPITPVPVKFLVPYLEQASLESPDSSLVDLWTDLLLSATYNFEPSHIHFVSIISRLSAKQGEIFRQIVGTTNAEFLEDRRDFINAYMSTTNIRTSIELFVKDKSNTLGKELSDAEFETVIQDMLAPPGIAVAHSSFENNKTSDYYDVDFDYMNYKDDLELDYSILEAVGLIKEIDTDFFDVEHWSVCMSLYVVTNLGMHFAKACRIVD